MRSGRSAIAARHQPRRVLRFGLPDDEACVAQGDDKPGKALAHRRTRSGPFDSKALRAHHAALMRLADEPARRLRADRGAVFAGLQERDQRRVHNLRVVMQILDLEAGEGGRPVERFGDAWNFLQVFLAQHSDHARDLKREIRVEVGLAVEQDRRFAVDVGKIEIVIEAAAAQRIRQFARGVGGQHDAWDRHRLDRAEFGNRDLEVRQELEQERLEFLVGAVDFVDQQDWRCLSA